MVFKRFRYQVIFRVLLIALFLAVFVYAIYQEKWYMATFISAIFTVALVVDLIRYVERTNRELGNFISSIKNKDFTSTYTAREKDKSYAPLYNALNDVIHEFRNVRIEKEIHYQYLQRIVEHIEVAMICFDLDGNVQLVNQAARELLKLKRIRKIESIGQFDKKLLEVVKEPELEQGRLVKIIVDGEMLGLTVRGTMFKIKNKPFKLVSFQDIKTELEEQELESWQKLIRVLTHEIMNSVTPVSSLSTAINEMLSTKDGSMKDLKDLDPNDLKDLYYSMQTIEERSKGLLGFVGTYKNLTRLPKPGFSEVKVIDLLNHLNALMKTELEKKNIRMVVRAENKDLIIRADHEMVERVMINLIVNAMQAMEGKAEPKIDISATTRDHHVIIRVSDNGRGIDKENIDKIFIPFFTTRKQGSGIGLSLARQIMRLHKGSVSLKSDPGKGTIVTLVF